MLAPADTVSSGSPAAATKTPTAAGADITWRGAQQEPDPYQLEWNHLISAIRNDRPHNEVQRGNEASLATSMGRMACHTGQVITREQMLASTHAFSGDLDELRIDGPAPLRADENGRYPVPTPGAEHRREF